MSRTSPKRASAVQTRGSSNRADAGQAQAMPSHRVIVRSDRRAGETLEPRRRLGDAPVGIVSE